MRKTIFWIIGIIAFIVVLTRADDLATLFNAIKQGAAIPLVLAVFFEVGRYVSQSVTMARAFATIGEKADWKRMIPLVVSGIFINTIAPSGGTAGAVLVVDDAIKRKIKPGKAATGAMLGQASNYAGFIIIMFIGFIILGVTGKLDPGTFLCGMVMVMVVGFVAGAIFICKNNEPLMLKWLTAIEGWVNRVCEKFHRKGPKPWAEKMTLQFAEASNAIAKNPKELIQLIGSAVITSAADMLCFIFSGLAFGITQINALVGGYVVTNIFTVVSPSPNGVGIAEVAATLILTAYGNPVSTATAVALVFRGFVFWIPFAIGALLLRRTGFFTEKENATADDKAKTTGYLAGLFVFTLGAVNTFFAILPSVPKNVELLSEWFDIGSAFSPTVAAALGLVLMLMMRGMIKRSRVTWAWTMVLLVYLAAFQLMSYGPSYVIIAVLALAVWLFIKRADFDKLQVYEGRRHAIGPIVVAIIMVLVYVTVGYAMLGSEYFDMNDDFFGILWATLSTFIPGVWGPDVVAAYGQWFKGSIITVTAVAAVWAVCSILFPYIRRKYYLKTGKLQPVPGIDFVSVESKVVADADESLDKDSAFAALGGDPSYVTGTQAREDEESALASLGEQDPSALQQEKADAGDVGSAPVGSTPTGDKSANVASADPGTPSKQG